MTTILRRSVLPLACIAIVIGILFGPFFVEGRSLFSRDNGVNFIPNFHYWHGRMSAGEFPLWNPYAGAGIPFAADPVQGVFYFPKLLTLAASDSVSAFNLLVFAHLVVAGWGMACLLLALGLRRKASLVGALVLACSGTFLTGTCLGQFLFAQSWMPWFLLGVSRTLASGFRSAGAILLMVATGTLAMLAADPQTFILNAGMAAIFVLTWRSPDAAAGGGGWNGSRPLRAIALVTGLLVVAVCISAVQWFPVALVVPEAARGQSGFSLALASAGARPWFRWLDLVLPGIWGHDLGDSNTIWPVRLIEPPYGTLYFASGYLGAASVSLAVLGLRVSRRFRTLFWFAAAVTVLGGWLCMGPHAPADLYRFFYQFVPGWDRFRNPERALPWFTFGMAILAALGLQAVLESSLRIRRWLVYAAAVMVILFAVLVLTDWLAVFQAWIPAIDSSVETVVWGSVTHGAIVLVTLAVLLFLLSRQPRYAGVLVLVIAADLLAHGTSLVNFTRSRSDFRSVPVQFAHILAQYSSAGKPVVPPRIALPGVLAGVPPGPSFTMRSFEHQDRETIHYEFGSLYGFSSPYTINSLVSRRLVELSRELWSDRYEVLQGTLARIYPQEDRSGLRSFQPAFQAGSQIIFWSRGNPARVICPREWIQIPDGRQVVDRLAAADHGAGWDFDRIALGPFGADGHRETVPEACDILEWSPERYDIRMRQAEPGLLVLRETYMRGWTANRILPGGAEVPVDILPVNHANQGVMLEAGETIVRFRYQTPGLLTGAAVSAVSVLVAMAIAIFAARRRPE
ncbi:MAG: hypothetical protein KIT79_04325 [Deltaproteobacteria bacterium]|nr:hypothetical protein [Deltaproteobacteria bacterium]